MNLYRQCLRIGASAILCALLLRLGGSDGFRNVADFLTEPAISSWILYLETGRIVRFSPSFPEMEVFSMESHTPDFAANPQALTPLPAFEAGDGTAVNIKANFSADPDVEKLITQPLQWDLTAAKPTVLILHTHTTESYTKVTGEIYEETAAFRTLDEGYNMVSIGDHLAGLLENGGVTVIHDRELHDYPSYNGSYNHARKSIQRHLKENPSICLVLDLHRDASGDVKNQMRTKATVDGQSSAQIMFVVGTNGTGLKHPNWKKNLALALKLQAQMERICAGICRNINLRGQRFNQDTSPGALLVEVGAAGNTREEALRAIEVLAQAILALSHGTGS